MQFINFNGTIHRSDEPLIQVGNRGFKYGDGFFESMVMFNRKLPLLDLHRSRIEYTADALFMQLPTNFALQTIENQILELAEANKNIQNARVRMQFYRKGDGLYLPDTDDTGYIITMDVIENSSFRIGDGLQAGLRTDFFKPVYHLSDLKISSALPYVQFAQFASADKVDEIILLNNHSKVCETIYSNVFMVLKNKLVTPDLDSGCVNGVMRSYLLSELEGNIEERTISPEELLEADEIILTNAVKGIQWIRQLGTMKYTNKKAEELTDFLNKHLLTRF
ncbi:MAG: aminotransferase class IV [Chitinophagales bacterium]